MAGPAIMLCEEADRIARHLYESRDNGYLSDGQKVAYETTESSFHRRDVMGKFIWSIRKRAGQIGYKKAIYIVTANC